MGGPTHPRPHTPHTHQGAQPSLQASSGLACHIILLCHRRTAAPPTRFAAGLLGRQGSSPLLGRCMPCAYTHHRPTRPPPLPRPGGGGCAAPLCMCGCTNTRAKRQWGGRTWRVPGAEQYTLQRFLGFFGLARLHTHAAHPQAERAGMAGTQPPHCLASGAELCVSEWGWKLLRAWRWNRSWVRCISSPHTDPHKRAVLHFWCWPFTGGQKAGMHHLHHSTATPPEWHWEHRCRSPLRVCVVGGKWRLET